MDVHELLVSDRLRVYTIKLERQPVSLLRAWVKNNGRRNSPLLGQSSDLNTTLDAVPNDT